MPTFRHVGSGKLVEARLYDGKNHKDISKWMAETKGKGKYDGVSFFIHRAAIDLVVPPNSWVMRAGNGSFFYCTQILLAQDYVEEQHV